MDAICPAVSPLLSRAHGFTLVELMITLAITALVAAVGVPALSRMLEDNKVAASADLLVSSAGLARGQAAERNTRVAVCRSTDGSACAADGDWRAGWIVFVDEGTIGTRDTADTILAVQSQIKSGGQIVTKGNLDAYLSYLSNGQTRTVDGAVINGSFNVCAGSVKAKRRRLQFSPGSGAIDVKLLGGGTCKS